MSEAEREAMTGPDLRETVAAWLRDKYGHRTQTLDFWTGDADAIIAAFRKAGWIDVHYAASIRLQRDTMGEALLEIEARTPKGTKPHEAAHEALRQCDYPASLREEGY